LSDGCTALHFASSKTGSLNEKIVRILLQANADLSIVDNSGDTALHEACQYGRLKNVKMFLENGADFALKNKYGKTPADIAARFYSEKNFECLRLLVREVVPKKYFLDKHCVNLRKMPRI